MCNLLLSKIIESVQQNEVIHNSYLSKVIRGRIKMQIDFIMLEISELYL